MKYSTIFFASTVAAAVIPSTSIPSQNETEVFEKRGGPDYSYLKDHPIKAVSASAFKSEFPAKYIWGDQQTLNAGYNAGQPYAAVYDPGNIVFTQADADVIKCLINLHVQHKYNCISVARSSCDNGYILGGGRFQNVNIDGGVSGQQEYLSGTDSIATQGAVQSLVGTKIRTDGNYGPGFYNLNGMGWAGAASIGQPNC